MRQRDLKFTFVVGEGKLAFDVVEFELEEALCEPFRLNLKLASDKNAIDFKQVLDQPGTFTLWHHCSSRHRSHRAGERGRSAGEADELA